MKIAITGLGRMGSQIARKLADDNHEVIAHDRSNEPIDEATKYGAIPAYDKQTVIDSFNGQQVVLWIMIPAEVVGGEIDSWLEILPKGSIIIDGGNSDYRDDKKRSFKVTEAGSTMLDIGTSGGVWGIVNGFSMMIGGDKTAYKTIK